MRDVTVIRPGMLTTVQDLGRWGLQAKGVPVAGPMDEYSHVLANRLVGNDPNAAALEVTLLGPELQSDADVMCAVAGASFVMAVGDRVAPMNEPFVLRAGQRLQFGARTRGARATLAFAGGIALPPVFGSRATSLISRMGPFDGRPLRAGDLLPIGDVDSFSTFRHVHPIVASPPLAMPAGGAQLRVIRGPHEPLFTLDAFETLFTSRFTITPRSNRMGYRLEGPPLTRVTRGEILSDPTAIGSIQVPPSGQPILLMADRQTTGGYPKIATVISADLPLAGQLAPGDWIEFRPCTRRAAVDARRARFNALEGRRS
jgi:antagonist of KipI